MNLRLGDAGGQFIGFETTSWDVVAEDALARWNNTLGRFRFSVTQPSVGATPCVGGDGLNTVGFRSTLCTGDGFGDALALTRTIADDGEILEADVIFNSTVCFNAYFGPLRACARGGVLNDLHRVALHEFGHVLGLDHPDEAGQAVVAIMNSQTSDVDSLQGDDIAGGEAIYPGGSPSPVGGQLVNVSTRGVVGTGDAVLIGGFVIADGAQTVLLRVPGPSLSARGVTGVLANPTLELFAGSTSIGFNDDWQGSAQAAEIAARGLGPESPPEPALLVTLNPGAYTAVVRGVSNITGVALVEVFAVD
jgi:hypothetical protein